MRKSSGEAGNRLARIRFFRHENTISFIFARIMLEYHIRPAYQKWLADPVARLLIRRLTPNAATLLSLLAGLLAGVAIALGSGLAGGALLVLSGFFDTLDGTLARLRGESSLQGAMYDIVSDRCVESAVILGLYLYDPAGRGVGCLLMLSSVLVCVTTFLMAGIFLRNDSEKSFNYSPGLMERPEAFIMFLLMLVLPGWFTPLAILFVALVFYTSWVRLCETARAMAHAGSEDENRLP